MSTPPVATFISRDCLVTTVAFVNDCKCNLRQNQIFRIATSLYPLSTLRIVNEKEYVAPQLNLVIVRLATSRLQLCRKGKYIAMVAENKINKKEIEMDCEQTQGSSFE
jgi:hypothetical protein